MPRTPVFDLAHYQRLNSAREDFLRPLLSVWGQELGLRTALDVGCGLGYFASSLRDIGFQVQAIDGRPENVQEARNRYPGIEFNVANVEDATLRELGSFDLVVCLGLLYHLENPFLALRNLHALTEKVLIIESMCVPERKAVMWFLDEGPTEDQGLHHIAFYPSETCLLKMCHRAGFPFVYLFSSLPKHVDFGSRPWTRRRRTMLAASKSAIKSDSLVAVPDGYGVTDPWSTGWQKLWAATWYKVLDATRPFRHRIGLRRGRFAGKSGKHTRTGCFVLRKR